jgi:hypothetical protein
MKKIDKTAENIKGEIENDLKNWNGRKNLLKFFIKIGMEYKN